MMALQASVGNRAATKAASQATRATARVARVATTGPEPTAFAPGSPVAGAVLGQTDIVASTAPKFTVNSETVKPSAPANPADAKTASIERGKVEPTTEGSTTIEARYRTEGQHPMDPSVDGTPRQLLVTPEVAALTKKGEQEHSDDFTWEHRLVFGEAARAVNALSRCPPIDGPDITTVHYSWRAALHREISSKLRVDAGASDPRKGGSVTGPWFGAKSKLHDASLERDRQKWHSMKLRKATAAEKEANAVPVGTELIVTREGGEIGQHPSEALIRKAFEALPDRA